MSDEWKPPHATQITLRFVDGEEVRGQVYMMGSSGIWLRFDEGRPRKVFYPMHRIKMAIIFDDN